MLLDLRSHFDALGKAAGFGSMISRTRRGTL